MQASRHAANSFLCLILAASLVWLTPVSAANDSHTKIIRLATTTSTENSGLLGFLLPKFTQQTGYRVHVIAVGTGKALRMGHDGDVDVVLVHAPKAEAEFVAKGFGTRRHSVMYNDFVLIGPPHDPAGINTALRVTDAMHQIADHNALFISRGDDSGTHKKELTLWDSTQLQPGGNWYREAGQGMGKVIQIADELEAYTLTDRGTWLAYRDKSSLKLLFAGDPLLHNPYGIIAVNPKRFPDINYSGANSLIAWITTEPAQTLIANYQIAGSRLFTPSANAPGAVAASVKQ
ncbi:MAG: solute-binding protein [Halobacteria archaeon]|nr:solute-binding protein [Halobacteria archaeon]